VRASIFWTISVTEFPLVRRFAVDVVGPKVREMDEAEMMDPAVVKGLFEQGVSLLCFDSMSVAHTSHS
jgi:hypothetical protein